MESIRDVLGKIQIPKSIAEANMATSSTLSCPTCGGAGWLRVDVGIDDPRFGQVLPCGCKAKELEEKRMQLLQERSNLGSLRMMTFASFFPHDYQQSAFDHAKHFADNPQGWLVFLGGFGTGKTHLAAAIGNRRLELGEPAVFMVAPDLLDHLRATFNPASETEFDALFEGVRSAPLLILDDLGTQTTTAWASEKLFQILNHRYMGKLPTVITTNVPLEELGDRLASRMADPDLSIAVSLVGPDMRSGRSNTAARSAGGRGRPGSRSRTY